MPERQGRNRVVKIKYNYGGSNIMTTITLIFLVFIGSMVMNVFGTAIYINEEIKPVLEEVEIPEDTTLRELLKVKK